MGIGDVIAARVDERGISYSELARRVDVNQEVLRRICKGDSMPKGDQLVRICVELGLDIGDFSKVMI